MVDEVPLILLPGMGADERMFTGIRIELPHVTTPPWIAPVPSETIASYARRFADVIDPGRPFFLGGSSFGGVVAQEIAAVLPNVRTCFVIGSIRSEHARPWRLQLTMPLTPFVGILPSIAPLIGRMVGSWIRPPTKSILQFLGDADPAFLRWGTRAILKWKPSYDVATLRVFQIHGDRDRVFPVDQPTTDRIIHGAGHLICITHPKEVAAVLREQIDGSA